MAKKVADGSLKVGEKKFSSTATYVDTQRMPTYDVVVQRLRKQPRPIATVTMTTDVHARDRGRPTDLQLATTTYNWKPKHTEGVIARCWATDPLR